MRAKESIKCGCSIVERQLRTVMPGESLLQDQTFVGVEVKVRLEQRVSAVNEHAAEMLRR